MNPYVQKTIDRVVKAVQSSLPIAELEGKTILITGASGFIGEMFALSLLALNARLPHKPLHLLLNVRNAQKLKWITPDHPCVTILESPVESLSLPEHITSLDVILHLAAPTASKMMAEQPVEVIQTIYQGTQRILEIARQYPKTRIINVSTQEVYAAPFQEGHQTLSEDQLGHLDLYQTRNSYPAAKRLAEHLCYAYHQEYQLDTVSVRLARVFGPGMEAHDKRFFTYCAQAVAQDQDIQLSTPGQQITSWIDITDALIALYVILFKAKSGSVLNVANSQTLLSIAEMAERFVQLGTQGKRQVIYQLTNSQHLLGTEWILDTSALSQLGFTPRVSIDEAITTLIQYVKTELYPTN